MKKILLITSFIVSALLTGCSKSSNFPDPDAELVIPEYNQNLNIVTTLAGGTNNKSGWLVTADVITYYNSANQVVHTLTFNMQFDKTVWEFGRIKGTNYFKAGTYDDFIKNGNFYNLDNFMITTEGGKNYLVITSQSSSGVLTKSLIESNSATSFQFSRTDVSSLYYSIGNTTYTAHHAKRVTTITKM